MSGAKASVDLLRAGLMASLPKAFLSGDDLDLLAPLEFATEPGDVPPAPEVERAGVAAALASANAAYGHPRAEALAAKLADPRTRVVFTGQQPGLFGGPLYTLSKAIAAAIWAERLEAAGESAVALFWVATEDHDYLEVARASVLAPDGLRTIELGEDPSPLTPVGMRTLGPGVTTALEAFAAANPGDRWQRWTERLSAWYRPEARFGEAFSRLLVGLLGERSPLLVDSMLPEVKEAQRPFLRRLVEVRSDLTRALAERESEIVGRGHALQVRPQPEASPLFLLRGSERRRLEWRGAAGIALRGEPDFAEDVDWLLDVIDENPGVVSPGVLARATLQDAVFGTSVLVLGPGEVSYFPQVAPTYERLDVALPRVALRPQILVLGGHQLDKLSALPFGLEDLASPTLDLEAGLAGGEAEDLVGPLAAKFREELERLGETVVAIDAGLENPLAKTRDQIDRALSAFNGRLTAALARRRETDLQRAASLREAVRPQGALQERVVSTVHFPGKYGDRFVEACFEQMTLDSRTLQVVSP